MILAFELACGMGTYTRLIDENEILPAARGKVIILNGPMCQAKSFVMRELVKSFPTMRIASLGGAIGSIDADTDCYTIENWQELGLAEDHLVLLRKIMECSRNTSLIVCDAVLLNKETYADISAPFCRLLKDVGFDVALVLMYIPLNLLLHYARQRDTLKIVRSKDVGYRYTLSAALQFLYFYALTPQPWQMNDCDSMPFTLLRQQVASACQLVADSVPKSTCDFFNREFQRWFSVAENTYSNALGKYTLYAAVDCDKIFYYDIKHDFMNEIKKLKKLCY
jgi:hypothetical protein